MKPTSYDAFEVNGAGRNNLLRSLSLTCDMCIVDLTGDVAGSTSDSTNIGQRNKFIFTGGSDSPSPSETESQDSEQDESDQEELEKAAQEAAELERQEAENARDAEQQNGGDMPGEDLDEGIPEGEPGESEMPEDPDGLQPDQDEADTGDEDMTDPWEQEGDMGYGPEEQGDGWQNEADPNGDLNDSEMDREDAPTSESESESNFLDNVCETL